MLGSSLVLNFTETLCEQEIACEFSRHYIKPSMIPAENGDRDYNLYGTLS